MPQYKGVYQKKYKTKDGKPVKKYYGAKWHEGKTHTTQLYTRAEDAANTYNDLVQELERGSYSDKRNITVSSFIDLWLEEFLFPQTKSEDGIAETTFSTIENNLKTVKKYIGSRILQKLTTKELDKLQNDLRLKYSSAYAHSIMNQLKRVLVTALQWKYIKKNPIDDIHKRKAKSEEVLPYTIEELFLMLKYADDRSADIIALAGIQGMRRSEIFGLMKKDILLQDRMIIIERQYYQSVLLDRTKLEAGKRIIPIFSETEFFLNI